MLVFVFFTNSYLYLFARNSVHRIYILLLFIFLQLLEDIFIYILKIEKANLGVNKRGLLDLALDVGLGFGLDVGLDFFLGKLCEASFLSIAICASATNITGTICDVCGANPVCVMDAANAAGSANAADAAGSADAADASSGLIANPIIKSLVITRDVPDILKGISLLL